jgi:hypothetical protein
MKSVGGVLVLWLWKLSFTVVVDSFAPSLLLPSRILRLAERSPPSPSALSAQRLRRLLDDDDDEGGGGGGGGRDGIPQLPPPGDSSLSKGGGRGSSDDVGANSGRGGPFVASRKFELQYTCCRCETRNCHRVSRTAYTSGVVIARCGGCDARHLIADNLGWTDYRGGFEGPTINTIEEFFAAKGKRDSVSRVSQEVFQLEKLYQGHDTESGSIVGDDGKLAME